MNNTPDPREPGARYLALRRAESIPIAHAYHLLSKMGEQEPATGSGQAAVDHGKAKSRNSTVQTWDRNPVDLFHAAL